MTKENKAYCIFSKNKKFIKEEGLENAYKEIEQELKNAVLSENVIVFAGAGSSIGRDGIGGKSMKDLWEEVETNLKGFDRVLEILSKETAEQSFFKEKNLEELLSRLQIEKQARANKGIDFDSIEKVVVEIEKVIEEKCKFSLPDNFPHEGFLKKLIKARKKSSPRLKIFTLNYDTCFEEAGDRIGAVVIDGFSFASGGKFKSNNFDLDIVQREQSRIHKEENFYDKVFHLYKIHGSVNWEKPSDKNFEVVKKQSPKTALLIYPNSSKFESSYQMPFFEMISRFQMALRTQNTALIIIGYSFGDNHLNQMIEEALRSNFNLKVFVVSSSIKEPTGDEDKTFREKMFNLAARHSGLTLIADSFDNFSHNLPEISFSDKERDWEDMFNPRIKNKNEA
jgi:hypothetical protein